MARPLKEGMDYFPHDTDASNDEKIEALRALHGNDGYAFYFILLERIYRTPNAELDISKPAVRAALIAKIGVSPDKFEEMLQTAFDVDCLSRSAYEERQVLTSNGIKRRAAEVQSMRERWRKQKENREDNPGGGSGVFRAENPEDNPKENAEENAEETGERKEKKIKEKENNNTPPTPPTPSVAEQPQARPDEVESITLDEHDCGSSERYNEFISRYTPEQQEIIAEYWETIRFTRKSARIADSVKIREMEYWLRFPPDVVIEALKIHCTRYHTKQEDYTRGIMRRLMREKELEQKAQEQSQPKQEQELNLIEFDPQVLAAWRERYKRAREKGKQVREAMESRDIPDGHTMQPGSGESSSGHTDVGHFP